MSQIGPNNISQRTGMLPEPSATTKKPYKVVLESVTQEKKKLRSTISYEKDAPSGYTFVPVGAPDLTEYCKELSRKRGLQVFIVSTEPNNKAHKNPNNISHHIHRVGHHFRNDIVDLAVAYTNRGPRHARSRNQRGLGHSAIARRLDNHAKRLGSSGGDTSPGRERQKVAGAIKDLFPKIPKADQEAIVARAFEEGTARVGNANLPLARRVQLAVVAHIRHTKTNYDNILKGTNWQNARQRVEQACLDQIVKWRGEDDADEEELEDIFQEVIVLDDDDDESDTGSSRSRDSSVEFISTKSVVVGSEENGNLDNHRSQAPVSRGPQPRNETEIIHVQPRRALAPPPVLQQSFRRRWNEARARVGFATAPDDLDPSTNVAPAVYPKGASGANGKYEHYARNANEQRHLQASVQASTSRPHSGQRRTSNPHLYPSVETPDRQRQVDASRPVQLIHHRPLVLYDTPINPRNNDANKPFYVPENQMLDPEYSAYDESPYGSRKSAQTSMPGYSAMPLHGVKRKSLNQPAAQMYQTERVYLDSPLKRARLIDQDEMATATAKPDYPVQQVLRGAPHTRSLPSVHYEPLEYASPQRSADRYDRYSPEGHQNIHARPDRDVEYLTTDMGERRTRSLRNAVANPMAYSSPQPVRSLMGQEAHPQQYYAAPSEYTYAENRQHQDYQQAQAFDNVPQSEFGYHLRQRRAPVAAPALVPPYHTLPSPQQRGPLERDGQVVDDFQRMRMGRR